MNQAFLAPQLTFNWPFEASSQRDDFFLTPANKDAFHLIDGWPHWPVHAVLLRGPEGAGKSHLASLWAETARARQLVDAADIEQAVTSTQKAFLIELDASALAAETALFHLINRAFLSEIFLLLTASMSFNIDEIGLRDLRSRLRALPQVSLHAPDDSLLRALLVKQFTDRQIEVAPEVVEFVLQRIERTAYGVKKAVETLDQLALSEGRRLTKANVARYLKASQAFEETYIQPSLNLST